MRLRAPAWSRVRLHPRVQAKARRSFIKPRPFENSAPGHTATELRARNPLGAEAMASGHAETSCTGITAAFAGRGPGSACRAAAFAGRDSVAFEAKQARLACHPPAGSRGITRKLRAETIGGPGAV